MTLYPTSDTTPSSNGLPAQTPITVPEIRVRLASDNQQMAGAAAEELEKVVIKVGGMTCASCVASIERNIRKVEGE